MPITATLGASRFAAHAQQRRNCRAVLGTLITFVFFEGLILFRVEWGLPCRLICVGPWHGLAFPCPLLAEPCSHQQQHSLPTVTTLSLSPIFLFFFLGELSSGPNPAACSFFLDGAIGLLSALAAASAHNTASLAFAVLRAYFTTYRCILYAFIT